MACSWERGRLTRSDGGRDARAPRDGPSTLVEMSAASRQLAAAPAAPWLAKKRREAPSFTAGRERRWARRARCPSGQSDPCGSRALNGRGEHGSGGPVLQGREDVHLRRLASGPADATLAALAAPPADLPEGLRQVWTQVREAATGG